MRYRAEGRADDGRFAEDADTASPFETTGAPAVWVLAERAREDPQTASGCRDGRGAQPAVVRVVGAEIALRSAGGYLNHAKQVPFWR